MRRGDSAHPTTLHRLPGPSEVSAGGDLTFNFRVACPSGCDLRGRPVSLTGPDGVVLVVCELTTHDGKGNETGEFTVKVPDGAGEYGWSAVFARQEADGLIHEGSSLDLCVQVRPHRTSVAVWDVPSPVPVNGSFRVAVGVKCSDGCRLAEQALEVCDETGTSIGVARTGQLPWPGTTALYWSEAELTAPANAGQTSWTVRLPASDTGLPHAGSSCAFGFVAVESPDHQVTVKVVEEASGVPLANVGVRVGPYHAETDDAGRATVDVAGGTYELSVWKAGYKAPARTIEVRQDLTVDVVAAEVHEEPIFRWG